VLALVIIDTLCVALLAVLVAGLLRSHADIVRALHDLGAGVGDPSAPESGPASAPVPLTMGPALPRERTSSTVHDVTGQTPDGDAVSVSALAGEVPLLLVFLSSGCTTCAGIWSGLGSHAALVPGVRPVVVTKGPEQEITAEVRRRAPGGVPVVMSTQAWIDYEVPGSPFFVLVDPRSGRRLGEGVANRLEQVADLVRRADTDADAVSGVTTGRLHLDGPAREADNDRLLAAAGILPGDPSLYPGRRPDPRPGR
jgi:hypothetical protein